MNKERQRKIELAALAYYKSYGNKGYSSECNFTHGAQWADEHPIGWHDLRKDPNDLPKLEDIIIVCKEFMGTEIIYEIECYYPRNWTREASEQKRKRVLAWMEIPKFK